MAQRGRRGGRAGPVGGRPAGREAPPGRAAPRRSGARPPATPRGAAAGAGEAGPGRLSSPRRAARERGRRAGRRWRRRGDAAGPCRAGRRGLGPGAVMRGAGGGELRGPGRPAGRSCRPRPFRAGLGSAQASARSSRGPLGSSCALPGRRFPAFSRLRSSRPAPAGTQP